MIEKKVSKEEHGQRLDKALSNLTDFSRTLLTGLIREGEVLVNGEIKKAKYKVQVGDKIQFDTPEIAELSIEPENLSLEIIYEDADVAVVNKPQGMVVHPSAGHQSGTLVNGLLYQIKDLSTINGQIRPGIVHRIDKDTSGLLMVAKNDQAHRNLAQQLKDKTTKRNYLALTHGNLPHERGVIEAPIGRNPKERKEQAVIEGGKPAKSHFEVLEVFNGYDLVNLRLETGRTHQIRVHMAYIEHPVAGDPLYGPAQTLRPNQGQFLHAEQLGFTHPRTGKYLEFRVPVPKIFEQQIQKLRKEN